jgi:hypothetical protein
LSPFPSPRREREMDEREQWKSRSKGKIAEEAAAFS